jgi:hypothetical protein
MKTVIDTLTSATGWSGATITADTWPMFAASYLPGQLRMDFTTGQIATKTYSPAVNVAGRYGLAFNVISKNSDSDGYRLKVRFFSGVTVKEFWVPLTQDFLTVQFKNYLSTVDKIEFEATANISIFISEIIAYTDNIPIDAERGVKQVLDLALASEVMPQIGIITGSAGDKEVTIASPNYLDRYLCFTVGGETYQIAELTQDNKCKLTPFGNGPALATNKSAAVASLMIPVAVEPRENEAYLPGIAIFSDFDAEPDEEEEFYSPINDSFETSGQNRTRITGPYFKHIIKVEADARQKYLREICFRVFRKALRNKNIWINGRRAEISFDKMVNIPYDDATDFIGKLNVELTVRIGEDIWAEEIQGPWTITQETQQLPPQ